MDGNKLKRLREEKGLSITKLSRLTGVSKSYLSLIERDIHKNPGLDILTRIAKTLGVTVPDLVEKEAAVETEPSNPSKQRIKSTLKLEIELTEDQLTSQKLKQIKDFIKAIHSDSLE